MLKNTKKNLNLIENTRDGQWWTEDLYFEAYEQIEASHTKKFPIFIPSIGTPNEHFGHVLAKTFTKEFNWPIFILTRDSQLDAYQDAINYSPYVTVLSQPDATISNAGASRKYIQDYAIGAGHDFIFMFDDDLFEFNILTKGVTENDFLYSKISDCRNQARILAVWQVATQYLNQKYAVNGTFPNYHSVSWPYEYSTVEKGMTTFSDYCSQAVCTNVLETANNKIYYHENDEVGHEDCDYYARGLDRGLIFSQLKFLTFSAEGMDLGNFTIGASLEDRFFQQMTEFVNGPMNWLSRPWLYNKPMLDGSIVPGYDLKMIRAYHNMPANFKIDLTELNQINLNQSFVPTPNPIEALGFETLEAALSAPASEHNQDILLGQDAGQHQNYLLRWQDRNDELVNDFWRSLQSIWYNLDETYRDHSRYPKFMTHISEFYFSSFYSHEAGSRDELGIQSQSEWERLKERALFKYRNKHGHEAIIFIP
ncbi:hypothetical protein H9L19_02230 [Weissella diestrammenae]|uniref:TET-Associated Glycosyltransferase domain-containing protein n=1 Tax=Weissella diestrammenae TaxID=1162633 RepID=A0A7G9T6I3_9LACO|nr:hypothetical protein [Weissella diestrammenae]MCM0583237.1 hypothetical protein [Weissella diestrammenae]QNN75708.1 hypothetical protein H9L19_02230 [Weissella diestrammenae]